MCILVVLLALVSSSLCLPYDANTVPAKVTAWLKDVNVRLGKILYDANVAEWNYNTDINNQTKDAFNNVSTRRSFVNKELATEAKQFDIKAIKDSDVKRQFSKITNIGPSALSDPKKVAKLTKVTSELQGLYSTGKFCPPHKACLNLDPGLQTVMAKSRDSSKLLAAWWGWRNATGPKMRDLFEEQVHLMNEGTREAGMFNDTGQYWRSAFESPTFQEDLVQLLEELRPLYAQLHAYVRGKLQEVYGADIFPSTGHIPAHLLGNMWAQHWNNIYDIVVPFKNKPTVDISDELVRQNYTARRMFETAEEFYTSLGLDAMPDTFWKDSMLTKPTDGREVVCHPSAWDFFNGKDFRIKMCTKVNMEDLITIHHEMGHIQYFLQYKNQPEIYRDGANPGFHEAIGDTMALSVSTPSHLRKIGLLASGVNDEETDINFLMKIALGKIAFLPFGYLIDQWRWAVFSGQTPPNKYNHDWWQLRCEQQGISPPVERSEHDFDPGAKFHVSNNVPYIRYFVSYVVQFQFHKALCDAAGHTGPLHKCDIYRSKEAGNLLSNALNLGSSKSWPEVMKQLTGQEKMDVSALKDYFKPLSDWLEEQNRNKTIGWPAGCPISDPTEIQTFLDDYNTRVQEIAYKENLAGWAYETNMTDYNKDKSVQVGLVGSKFRKESARKASLFETSHIHNSSILRQLHKITDIGTDGLKDESKIEKLSGLIGDMLGVFSKGKVCLNSSTCLDLQPGLSRLLSRSRDYDKLKTVWKKWRDNTGKPIKDKYAEMVRLSNEGVRELGYKDTGAYWRSWYETPSFQQDLEILLDELKPLYQQLHTYVRKKLRAEYGDDKFPVTGHIPAHILGNMWAQEWGNIFSLVTPYPGMQNVDVTPTLVSKNFTVNMIFKTAEEFFTSIGLSKLPDTFWNNSMLEKPKDGRTVDCYASATDMGNQKDFRIKMCTDITMEDLITVHHEMGHVEYYLQYKNQPFIFRRGANHGFHEAIGDTMALSASSLKHLKTIGLLKPDTNLGSHENDINFLMKTALDKIAFLPFGYLIDQWRWSVFSGETPPSQYNRKWWDLRCKYQGIYPPVPRSDDDFDPGSKLHVADNVPYIRYFVSFVIQFQFHEALCNAAGHKGPLHKCDIYRSHPAGDKLRAALALGSSQPWPVVMKQLTGQSKMNVSSIKRYFQPLIDWLVQENGNESQGWTEKCPISDARTVESWIKNYNTQAEDVLYNYNLAYWTYNTNITDYNEQKTVEASMMSSNFAKRAAANLKALDTSNVTDPSLQRQIKKIENIGPDALKDEAKLKRLSEVQAKMEGIFSTGKVCINKDDPSDCLDLEPGIARKFANSHNYQELEDIWRVWRDVTGKKMKTLYAKLVELSNEGIRQLGYADTGEYWRDRYETRNFTQDLEALLEQLKPLYSQLHTYIRRQLKMLYGPDKFPATGHIPAHLLGNLWAQSWENIFNSVQPYKNKQSVDITSTLKARNFTTHRMFTTAEDFYKSIGLSTLPDTFWKNSILDKPTDGRGFTCYASAWDMGNRKDFRIKMCTDITMEDLNTIHHEMGHVEYFLQYKNQPITFRDGANAGFHEAIGDTMVLSSSTPKHLRTINLLAPGPDDTEGEINFLMKTAMDKIAFLPFGYLIDQWRWSVFSGETTPKDYNKKWWELRCKYQGISPPVARSEDDFDPGAKYHVAANVPYIRYFVSFVIQFQFHEALCKAAGHTGPLHRCDIYGSKAAGAKFKSMLELGSSKPWQEAMELVTGQRNMNVSALLNYFEPLTKWLTKQNQLYKAEEDAHWTEECPGPSGKITDEQSAKQFMMDSESETIDVIYKQAELDWTYSTNITNYNSEKAVNNSLKLDEFTKRITKQVNAYDWENFKDPTLKREFMLNSHMGTSALTDTDKLEQLSQVLSKMQGLYSTGNVSIDGEYLGIEPGLIRIMADSRNYSFLLEAWKAWRDATGPQIKPLYEKFVQLSNEGIQADGYRDTGEYWRSSYETKNFEESLQKLLHQLQPLYQQLHAYVRKKLKQTYGENRFPTTGHIPAHLLGNMWAQEWTDIYDIVEPFKGKAAIDVTDEMRKQKYTVHQMFKTAESFYKSLGLKGMPEPFWNKSLFAKPKDGRKVVCHASAWDFFNKKDFRIKMCTNIDMNDLITIHHEMGHIQYYLQYNDLPSAFKTGANPGFHEAIGDTMALSVSTPGHLHKIGLLPHLVNDNETDINYLLRMALDKIAFLPFGYLIDQWRWSVFSGDTTPNTYNEKWWDLRCQYQGVSAPVERTEQDFDPAAKSHIPSNTPYIRYFVSFVIQFQFHKALCDAAGHTGPLYKCDIYNSTEAGKKFGDMLRMGKSKPWPYAMEAITGQREMDVAPLVEYFQPLLEWLKKETVNEKLGWDYQCPPGMAGRIHNEQPAREWLQTYNREAENIFSKLQEAEYTYVTNITQHNRKVQTDLNVKSAKFTKAAAINASHFDVSTFQDKLLKRELKFIQDIGTDALHDEKKLSRMVELKSKMEGIYSTGKVKLSSGKTLELEPGLTRLMASSRNYSELLEAWKGWRDATGKTIKTDYKEFVELSNMGVQDLGYQDTGEYWRSLYETCTFKDDLVELLQQLQPLYRDLHAYTRRKLRALYGADKFPSTGHIPAHLFGNMWSQEWNNIYDIVIPYKNKPGVDVTPQLKKQGYTVEKMFWTAEDFFKSLGLSKMPMPFWKYSMIRKPTDRNVVCHASAWDFLNGKDYRIKMCTDINMEDLVTIHHEMGHIQYYLQYKNQPQAFRNGANPGFHEAIGDVMALSASTPNHLHKIGLLEKVEKDEESDINFLMSMALGKIAFLPFGYLIDQWRWSVFSRETNITDYNKKWWDLRCKYQGISPPVHRSEKDFDPGAKYHVPANYAYIRYFVSYVVQFQFHKALCDAAGHKGPLHKCDIYKSKEAGTLLGNMLRLGSSVPWTEALKMVTGTEKMDVGPLMEYFQPLWDWLKKNKGEESGWDDSCLSDGDAQFEDFLHDYNKEAEKQLYKYSEAEWKYNTNITDYNLNLSVAAGLEYANFSKRFAAKANSINWKGLTSLRMKRQFKKITNIGTDAIKDDSKLKKLEKVQKDMEGIYSKAKVCLSAKHCVHLTPDLDRIMANSTDYNKLLKVWKLWRDNTGKKMRDLYSQFVNLSNEGVRELGYKDTGDYWRSAYESDTFQYDIADLLEEIHPLYEQLHAYVRRKLIGVYGADKFPESGHIPAHILGNMWGQTMDTIYGIVQPYKNLTGLDITPQMKAQGYTVERMFRTAENFFVSIGLDKMVDTFWTKSLMTRPLGRQVVCHASAWDFYNAKDFRMKMCTDINMVDLVTIHHEMGHIEYFMQYKDQPEPFRDGANPGFHEAIGDTMALSASTPGHLHKIGLLNKVNDNYLEDINFLMLIALDKIAFLPFGYLIDQWRWSVFSGETPPSHYNKKWWDLRCKYQGLSPPVSRSESDFDPGAKFHIPDNTPYIRYFVSYVVQFQFHKALCNASGHTGPLYKCDIYKSKAAGKLLSDMLRMGSSKPWPEAMEVITGQRKMTAGPLKEYFQPLYEWLQEQNRNERTGWSKGCPQKTGSHRNLRQVHCPTARPKTNDSPTLPSQILLLTIFVVMKVI